jgi:heme exporter protein B
MAVGGGMKLGRHITREWRVWWRQPGDWLASLLFFILPVALFGFANAVVPVSFQTGQSLILLVLVLALLLSLDRLFRQDWQSGILQQWRLRDELGAVIVAKLLVLIASLAIPLSVLGPVLVYAVMSEPLIWGVWLPLALVYAILALDAALLGIVTAALCLAARQPSIVLVLVFLPLCLPLLIFAMGAGLAAVEGTNFWPPLSVLVAWGMIGVVVVVPVTRYMLAELE